MWRICFPILLRYAVREGESMKGSIAGDAVKLTLVKVLTTLLTMLSAMLLSRFRTLEEYGTYSQIQLVVTVAVTVFAIGIPNSINYFLAKADTVKEQEEFLSVYYTTCTVAGITAGILVVFMLPLFLVYFKNQTLSIYWYFLLLYPWTKIMLSGIENILVVYQNLRKLFLFKISYGIITLAVIMLAWLAEIPFYTYMFLFLATEIVFSIWTYIIALQEAKGLHVSFEKKLIKAILVFSLPIGLSSIVSTISIEVDKLLIGYLYTTEEMAIYTNASKEMPVSIVATSITAVLMPQLVKMLAKGKKEEAICLWGKATQLSYIFIAFIAAALFVFAPEVITILYSQKYLSGTDVFRVYSLVLLLRVTYFGMVLNAIGKTKFIFYTSIVSLVLNVILNLICYFVFGFIGPAIATFLSIAIMALVQIVYTSREIKVLMREIFPWTGLLKITVINSVLGVCAYLAREWLLTKNVYQNVLQAVGIGVIWVLVYIVMEKNDVKFLWKGLN